MVLLLALSSMSPFHPFSLVADCRGDDDATRFRNHLLYFLVHCPAMESSLWEGFHLAV